MASGRIPGDRDGAEALHKRPRGCWPAGPLSGAGSAGAGQARMGWVWEISPAPCCTGSLRAQPRRQSRLCTWASTHHTPVVDEGEQQRVVCKTEKGQLHQCPPGGPLTGRKFWRNEEGRLANPTPSFCWRRHGAHRERPNEGW